MLTRRNESDTVLRTLDWSTVIIYLIMVLAGVISIYAASYDYDDAAILSFDEFSGKQALWVGLGLCIAGVIMLIEVRMFETYAYPIYVLTLLLLLVTPFLAPDIKGSRSWLVLGPMSLQPAEFAKFATALALAKLFSGYNFLLKRFLLARTRGSVARAEPSPFTSDIGDAGGERYPSTGHRNAERSADFDAAND